MDSCRDSLLVPPTYMHGADMKSGCRRNAAEGKKNRLAGRLPTARAVINMDVKVKMGKDSEGLTVFVMNVQKRNSLRGKKRQTCVPYSARSFGVLYMCTECYIWLYRHYSASFLTLCKYRTNEYCTSTVLARRHSLPILEQWTSLL